MKIVVSDFSHSHSASSAMELAIASSVASNNNIMLAGGASCCCCAFCCCCSGAVQIANNECQS